MANAVTSVVAVGTADVDRCDCNVIHEDIVAQVREKMPGDDILLDLADLFKVFSDSTRVRILCALQHSEMCVCDIAFLLGMTKSAISHQLRALRQTRLVKHRRDGKVVYYSLDDEHVSNIFEQGLIHICE
ncbi:MAG: metalloregulator ArsR/SmtB family transcription factor [Oscillospiraceae bacterium]|jgi:DNA-binding transcriptional ArsR family regulator|nr:metalloregulator ArsR/SmtB family transcription factor [Oscillospiraceae bacterium]